MSNTTDLTFVLERLARARNRADASKQALATAKAKFEHANAALIQIAKDDAASVESWDAQARALALDAYFNFKDAKPAPGITVGVGEKVALTYATSAAMAWAYEKKMALALDVKAFEKIASVTDLSFVIKTTKPTYRIAIASDLTKFYPVSFVEAVEPTPLFTPGYAQEEEENA